MPPTRFDRVLNSVGLYRESSLPAVAQGRHSAANDGLWARIGSGVKWRRDYSQQDMFKDLNEIFRAWRFNPFVKRTTENWVNFVVGSGIQFQANDERVQSLVVDPWLVENQIAARMRQRATEAFLFGEIICAPAIYLSSGTVKLGFVDPLSVRSVKYSALDGDTPITIEVSDDNGTFVSMHIISRDKSGEAAAKMPEMYGNRRPGYSGPLQTTGLLVGQIAYMAFNRILGASRGTSETLTYIDWCRGLEDLLWAARTRAQEQCKVVGTMTIKGATPQKLKQMSDPDSKEYVAPPEENGQWWRGNDNISLAYLAPQLGASDIDTAVKTFRTVISIGSGNPPHLYGEGDDTNYASAKEKGAPFYQMLEAGQRDFLRFWKDLVQFAVDQKRIFTNELDGVTDFTVNVTAPDVTAKNEGERANLGQTLTNTVLAWKQSGAINTAQAQDLIGQIAESMGLEIDHDLADVQPVVVPTGVQEAFDRIKNGR